MSNSQFYVVGLGGDPGESGIYRRGSHPSMDKMVISAYGLRKRGYDIHEVVTWSNEAVAKFAAAIEREEKRWQL